MRMGVRITSDQSQDRKGNVMRSEDSTKQLGVVENIGLDVFRDTARETFSHGRVALAGGQSNEHECLSQPFVFPYVVELPLLEFASVHLLLVRIPIEDLRRIPTEYLRGILGPPRCAITPRISASDTGHTPIFPSLLYSTT